MVVKSCKLEVWLSLSKVVSRDHHYWIPTLSLSQLFLIFCKYVQGGISRTTTAMVIASIVKEFQLASEINHMKGIVPDDILNALRKKKLGLPGIDTEAVQEKNALMAGEFEVILELLDAYKVDDQAKIAKAQVI